MRVTLVISTLLHVAVILVAYFGLPSFIEPLDVPPPAFEVELVAELEDEPEPEAKEEPKPEPPKTVTPPPPPPPKPPAPAPEAKPEPEVKAEPEPEPEAEIIPEKKKPKPEKKVEEKPKPKPAPVTKPQTVVKMPRPKAKPKEPVRNDFTSVLNTVEKLKDKPKPKVKVPEKKPEKKEDAFAKLAESLKSSKPKSAPKEQSAFISPDAKLSNREMDAVKRQIAGCWSIPAGAAEAEDLLVRLRVVMNPDMTVRKVDIDRSSDNGNPFWRTAAESAQRAVFKCSPLKLPIGKYDVWQIINFTFDPREMLG